MVLVLDGKTDLNQISLTGVRAIMLILLLSSAPRSFEEIREAFIDAKIMDESNSDDIIRVDLNTIKSFGCEISRSSMKTGYKYVLIKNPFSIPVTEEDAKILKRILDKLKNTTEISKILEYDKFITKIANYIYDDKVKELFLVSSPLNRYDKSMVYEIAYACMQKYTLKLMYKKQYVPNPVVKEIIAQRLVFNNDKLYLYGYDMERQDNVTLLFNRIREIVSKQITNNKLEEKNIKITFELENADDIILTESEKIMKNVENSYLIQGEYFNEFLAIQRILSFGSTCKVVEPEEFKNKIIFKLKEMKKLYENEN